MFIGWKVLLLRENPAQNIAGVQFQVCRQIFLVEKKIHSIELSGAASFVIVRKEKQAAYGNFRAAPMV